MIITNIFRKFKVNSVRGVIFACSCGYSETQDGYDWNDMKECPKCGVKQIDLSWNKIYKRRLPVVKIEKSEINDKSFDIVKVKYLTEIVDIAGDPILQINDKEIWHTTFDFMNECKLEIRKNGILLKNTKSNIQKALSYVDLSVSDVENTLFKAMADYSNETTASGIMYQIINNPFIEIFYNTYGNLKVVKNIPISLMDKSKTSPSQILGLNKPVWRSLLKLNDQIGCNINLHFNQIKKLDDENKNKPDYTVGILENISELGERCLDDYLYLIRKGYDYRRLYQYIVDDIYTYQGISDTLEGLRLLKDYVNMCDTMDIPCEKYPKSLKLVHDLANKNLKIKVSNEQQQLFKEIINKDDYKNLEYKGTYYSVINPKTTDDIVNEGRYLHHCVGSYVNTVIKGITKILFFRNNDNIDKPLITLEVRDGVLRQYKGRQNRRPTDTEMNEIIRWANLKGLAVW